MFDIVLLILLGLYFNMEAAVGGAILKLFGVQDILYYLFLQKELPNKWTWMKWTPLGVIKGDLIKIEIVLQGLVGCIICLIILLYY